ncbi:10339_t:CDS:2 [Ambispora gerdemannii]|uniref:10339_t:CDS:1 n=1 Tax=Ambispora gerdemannii TaxID=144530 RepID=A0A9N9GN52_9GLOM|nr:10339_t:CDS:2 [Ambispora gerdemannii]
MKAEVRGLLGVLSKYPENTIGIFVVPSKTENYTRRAVEEAERSKFKILLTDKYDICHAIKIHSEDYVEETSYIRFGMADPEDDNEFDNYSLTNDEYISTEQESNSFVSTKTKETTCKIVDNNGKVCLKTYAHGSTTSNMIYHLTRKHGIVDSSSNTASTKNNQMDIQTSFQALRKKKKKSIEYEQIQQNLAEFIIEDNQPFYILQSPGFRKLLQSLDANFEIPCDKMIKLLITKGYNWSCDQLKSLLQADSISVSLTTDFWTSRSGHGYIGITCTWISNNMMMCEALLDLKQVPYPHTGEKIALLLQESIKEWNLEKKTIAITTDNASSMVKALRLIPGIKRIPCTAHTLQLTVGKGLASVQLLILRAKRLLDFFNHSPKQMEKLHQAQKDLNFEKINSTICDVSTRWNSTFLAWDHLIDLKCAISYLPGRMQSDLDNQVRLDGKCLAKIMLTMDEWKLIEALLEVLEDFQELTTTLSGAKYPTLNLVYPHVKAIFEELEVLDVLDDLNIDLTVNEISIPVLNNNTNTIFNELPNLNCKKPIILKLMTIKKHQLSLKQYWQFDNELSFVSCLLDPRVKNLGFLTSAQQIETWNLVRSIYNDESQIIPTFNSLITNNQSSESTQEFDENSNRRRRKGKLSDKVYKITPSNISFINDEITQYDDMRQVTREVNPLDWWRIRKNDYPILYRLARKYLGISGTSVPSERLFSDVGNQILAKRTSLDPQLVREIIFLK